MVELSDDIWLANWRKLVFLPHKFLAGRINTPTGHNLFWKITTSYGKLLQKSVEVRQKSVDRKIKQNK